jgi:tetratricopeptide (TPR) repeat protein
MRRARALVFAGLAVALAASAFAWWSMVQTRTAWFASVPPVPELASWPAEFRERVTALTKRAAAREVAALGELSRHYHANGFSREAAQAYAGLERFDAADPHWPHLHAHILAGMGRLEEARPQWERAVELAPDYLPARVRLGEVLFKTNQAEAAAQVYAAALAAAPEDPYALLGLARCELQLGRMTAARERLQQVVAARPEFGAGWNLLATIYERLGNVEGAAAAQERAQGLRRFREMPDPWLDELLHECFDVYRLRVAAGAANAAGVPGDAVPWLERAARLAPENAAVHRDFGDVHVALRDFAAARADFEKAMALAPADEGAYIRLAALATTTGDAGRAARALAEGVAHCPRSAGLWFAHGRQLAATGRSDEALAALGEARRLQPDKADAYHEIATICFRLGRDAEGIAALESVLEHLPEHAPTLLALAQRAIETGDEAAALRWLTRARSRPDGGGAGAEDLARKFQQRFGRVPW